ncbi:MAG: hypothetical protein C0594_11035 [Marinilabiliales bacterium]|nr:MAG: hypothetical protein C0594_11035 [Marinilabiliales bacterium]
MKETIENLKDKYTIISEVYQRKDLVFITVEKKETIDLITYLKNDKGYTHFVLLTAVDWIEDGTFQLTYILNNPSLKMDIGVRADIPRENPVMDSIHHLWEQVSTYQRELKEMFGIDFPGSPRID